MATWCICQRSLRGRSTDTQSGSIGTSWIVTVGSRVEEGIKPTWVESRWHSSQVWWLRGPPSPIQDIEFGRNGVPLNGLYTACVLVAVSDVTKATAGSTKAEPTISHRTKKSSDESRQSLTRGSPGRRCAIRINNDTKYKQYRF